MIVITLACLPELDQDALETLREKVSRQVKDILEAEVVVLFPPDRLKAGLGEEVICLTDCFADFPQLALHNAAEKLRGLLQADYPQAVIVVRVRPRAPTDEISISVPEGRVPSQNAHIANIGLTARTENVLRDADILYARQLAGWKSRDLTKLKNFGRKCLADVRAALAKLGLKLADDK